MKLKSLSIRLREAYENEKGYTGVLITTSPSSEVKICLSDESCRKILVIAGEGVKEAARETNAFLLSQATLLAGDKLLEVSNDAQ